MRVRRKNLYDDSPLSDGPRGRGLPQVMGKIGIHMMIRTSSEKGASKEELKAKIACLQQLIAELLLKNQQLREALGNRKTEYTSSH